MEKAWVAAVDTKMGSQKGPRNLWSRPRGKMSRGWWRCSGQMSRNGEEGSLCVGQTWLLG